MTPPMTPDLQAADLIKRLEARIANYGRMQGNMGFYGEADVALDRLLLDALRAPVGLPSEEEVNLAAQAACAAFYSDDPIPPNTIVSPVWDGLSTRARGNWRRAARAILARLAGRESEGWRPEVRAFAELMEQKLRENDHKGGWKKELPSLDLLPRLREETEELDDAISHWGAQVNWGKAALYLPGCIERVGREAADVANFAMMIADVCGALAPALASPADSAEEEGR